MNATVAPTAKAPELSFEELGELVLKGKATPAEKADFLKQLEVKEKAVQARSGNIAKIKTEIEKLHKESPFEKDEWIDLLGEVYQAVAGHFRKGPDKDAAGEAPKARAARIKFHSDDATPLFVFPKKDGAPNPPKAFYKGRAFEASDEAVDGFAKVYKLADLKDGKPTWNTFKNAQNVPSGVQEFLDKDSYKYYIPADKKAEVEAYFKTEEGKKELEIVLEWADKGRKAANVAAVTPHPDAKAKKAA